MAKLPYRVEGFYDEPCVICGGKIGRIWGRAKPPVSTCSKQCGRQLTARSLARHGMAGSAEYRIWQGIRVRCTNERHHSYPKYGGRGIVCCERWGMFDNFMADMGPRPSPQHSIDRIDNDGPYSPENCRWATRSEQNTNKRSNRWIEHDGETLTLTQWARRLGVSSQALARRLESQPLQDAMTPGQKDTATVVLSIDGRSMPLRDWARSSGIDYSTIWRRLRSGWPAKDAVFQPVNSGKSLARRKAA